MSRTNGRPWGCVLLLLAAWLLAGTAWAGPAIDPRAMSGIPRPDPALAPGTVTVRCLLGGFDAPAVGVEVRLRVGTGSDAEERTAITDAVGRATFSDLAALAGREAVASAKLGGVDVRSRPFVLRRDAGTRLLLVAGAAPPAEPPSHARPDHVPAPGEPFALDGRPAGTLVVGTLDLRKGRSGRAAGRTVRLRIEMPDGTTRERTAESDEQGRATFEGLLPPDVPEDAKIVVEAQIAEDGKIQRSQPFRMGDGAKAVYLAEGFEAAGGHGAAVLPPPEPPKMDPGLPAGVVQVKVEDGAGRPVADHPVSVFKKDRAGNDREVRGTTGPDGVARIEGVPVQEDALYFAATIYGGGPYQSGFFRMEERSGVRLGLRVYPTTSDPQVVRSAVQFEVAPREKDLAQVVQVYQAVVEGPKAYWPRGPDGFRLYAPEGARGVTVLPSAAGFLEERENAPFAQLAGPLPPGRIVDLSIAYLLPHDGRIEVAWTLPFPAVETSVVLPDELTLAAPKVPGQAPPHPDPGRPVRVYRMGERPLGSEVVFEVTGLPTRPAIFRHVAAGGLLLVLGGVGVAFVRTRRRDLRLDLLAQREALARRYLASEDPAEKQRLLLAIDEVSRALDELLPAGAEREGKGTAGNAAASPGATAGSGAQDPSEPAGKGAETPEGTGDAGRGRSADEAGPEPERKVESDAAGGPESRGTGAEGPTGVPPPAGPVPDEGDEP